MTSPPLDITERGAYGIITELAEAGYVVKERVGRRNRYEIHGHLPLRGAIGREHTIAEVLDVLVEASGPPDTEPSTHQPDAPHRPASPGVVTLKHAIVTA